MSLFVQELAIFKEKLPSWLPEQQGRFVIICGETVGGFYSTFEDAHQVALEKFGDTPFLIKKVTERETSFHIATPFLVNI